MRISDWSSDVCSSDLTQQSPRGLLNFMDALSGQEVLLTNNQDPYLRTHPLTQDRIDFLRHAMQESPYADKPTDPELVRLHNRMRAKLIGFLQPLSQVLQSYPASDKSLPERSARAIASYRLPNIAKAVTANTALLQNRHHEPYF